MFAPAAARPEVAAYDQVLALYDAAQYLKAHHALLANRPLGEWASTSERILAARVLMQVGGVRQGRLLFLRAFRAAPHDLEALNYHALTLLRQRGPLWALRLLSQHPDLDQAPPQLRADCYLTRANALGMLRDFEQAEQWLDQAEALWPDSPWLWVQRGVLLEYADRFDDALTAARRSLALRPLYRPGVQMVANLLQSLARDDEALELLTHAAAALESGALCAQLALLQQEQGLKDAALASWERAVTLSPAMDKPTFRWLAGNLGDAHDACGNTDRALELYAMASEFHQQVAVRIAAERDAGRPRRRVSLPVPFVQQHHLTCVPATLAAIAAFWQRPADHLTVAAEICYDGTPSRSERRWAEEHGWAVREFTVTWEGAQALLDQGVAFTLTTAETSTSHLQAVIGYDSARGTLLLRDPSYRNVQELAAEAGLKRYSPTGPRGMALIPSDQAGRLDGLPLQDAQAYTLLFQLERALDLHDDGTARALLARLETLAPDSHLAINAARALAAYNDDQRALLSCAERDLARHPDQPRFLLWKLAHLGNLSRQPERSELVASLAARPKGESLFWVIHADGLAADARQHDAANFLLLRALRQRPTTGSIYRSLADLRWAQDRQAEALLLYRHSACLDDKSEGAAQAYFSAARHLGRTAEAIAFLEDRFDRFGKSSPSPARTLALSLEALDQMDRALAVCERALSLRGEDGELLLFAAGMFLRAGQPDRAVRLVDRAVPLSRPNEVLRARAAIDLHRLDHERALAQYQEILRTEPLALYAHREAARLLAETRGREATLAHLKDAVERWPHHMPLLDLYLDWLRDHDLPAAIEVVRRMLALHANDAWCHRELATLLIRTRQLDEAAQALERAGALEPEAPSYFAIQGDLLRARGQLEQAKGSYRAALERSADFEYPFNQLMDSCRTQEERRAELRFVAPLLRDRVLVRGEVLTSFQEAAEGVLPDDELLEVLSARLSNSPDLYYAPVVVIRQLARMRRLPEALEHAQGLSRRFGLVPGSWVELSRVQRAAGLQDDEERSLRHVLDLSPTWSLPSRLLSSHYERRGDRARARAELERAAKAAPLDGATHFRLAELLQALGERQAALEALERSLLAAPSFGGTWELYAAWTGELSLRERAEQFARELIRRRPHSAHGPVGLALILEPSRLAERLAALDAALTLDPTSVDACDLKARLLCEAQRFDEALAASRPPALESNPPLELEGRAAWILAERGALDEAIAAMERTLARAPRYVWGLLRITDWYEKQGLFEKMVDAAHLLLEAEPEAARSHGYLADALVKAGRGALAREPLRVALRLDPGYGFAAAQLFSLQLDAGELDEAAAVLPACERALGPAATVARSIQLAVRRRNREEARALFLRLCTEHAGDDGAYELAEQALVGAGWQRDLRRALRLAVLREDAKPPLGRRWAGEWVPRLGLVRLWLALRALQRRPAGETATTAALELLGEARRWFTVHALLTLFRARLRASTALWATSAYALNVLGSFWRLRWWVADWRSREGLEPWMLVNVSSAGVVRGHWATVREVTDRALALAADNATEHHHVWQAYLNALGGDLQAAERALPTLRFERGGYLEFLATLARALVAARSSPEEGLRLLGLAWPQVQSRPQSPLWTTPWHHAAKKVRAVRGRGRALWGELLDVLNLHVLR